MQSASARSPAGNFCNTYNKYTLITIEFCNTYDKYTLSIAFE